MESQEKQEDGIPTPEVRAMVSHELRSPLASIKGYAFHLLLPIEEEDEIPMHLAGAVLR